MRCSWPPSTPHLWGWLCWEPLGVRQHSRRASCSTAAGGWARLMDSLPCTTGPKGLQYNFWSCPSSQAPGWLAGGYPGQEEGLHTLVAGHLLTCRACLRRTAPKRTGMSGGHRSSTLNCAAPSKGRRTLATALSGLSQVPGSACTEHLPALRPLLPSQSRAAWKPTVTSCVLGQTTPAPGFMAGSLGAGSVIQSPKGMPPGGLRQAGGGTGACTSASLLKQIWLLWDS